eukprot:142926-Amphidinium_carterae.1
MVEIVEMPCFPEFRSLLRAMDVLSLDALVQRVTDHACGAVTTFSGAQTDFKQLLVSSLRNYCEDPQKPPKTGTPKVGETNRSKH